MYGWMCSVSVYTVWESLNAFLSMYGITHEQYIHKKTSQPFWLVVPLLLHNIIPKSPKVFLSTCTFYVGLAVCCAVQYVL